MNLPESADARPTPEPPAGRPVEPRAFVLAGPSRTSQAVALTRVGMSRPHSPGGDPEAQRLLCADLGFTPPSWLRPGIEARTRFMDGQVVDSLGRGVRQVVICGAGLDDRALRFRTEGVRFFEVDHPVTQADKARRLQRMGAGTDATGPTLAACDFQAGSVTDALAACGHDAAEPSLFLCEGLLVYLDADACRRLLAAMASCAGPGSRLAVSLATHASQASTAEVVATANARRRSGSSEPWRTILPAGEHLAMLSDSGWQVIATADSPAASDNVSHGRRSLLVVAGLTRLPSVHSE
jgi:methyltransferase (TIGR00027 family)